MLFRRKIATAALMLVSLLALAPLVSVAQVASPEALGSSDAESTDVGLVTRDPDDGKLLKGACYELVGYSNIGCDEDANGTVTFKDIPYGTYTVHQTTAPEGYEPMGDYEIKLEPVEIQGYGPATILLVQAETQGTESTGQMSVMLLDSQNGARLIDSENCVQFPGMTEVGCDDDAPDGLIDFVGFDHTHGQLTIDTISLQCGYGLDGPDGRPELIKYGEHTTVAVFHMAEVPQEGGCDN